MKITDRRLVKKWLRRILKEIIKDGMKKNTRPFENRRKR